MTHDNGAYVKWEYAVVEQGGMNAAALLNDWGLNGWELAAVTVTGFGATFYLKRDTNAR